MAENHFCSSSKNWYPHVIPVNTRLLEIICHFPLKEAVQYTAPVYKVLFIDPLTPFIPWSNENTCSVLEDNHIILLITSSMFLLLLLRPWRYYYHCVCPVSWCSSIVCLKWTITLPKQIRPLVDLFSSGYWSEQIKKRRWQCHNKQPQKRQKEHNNLNNWLCYCWTVSYFCRAFMSLRHCQTLTDLLMEVC